MATSKLPKSYLKAVENIKAKGFGFFKVELEADLNRGDNDYEDCEDCNGTGFNYCDACGGDGYTYEEVRLSNGDIEEVKSECETCEGGGEQECGNCYGRGTFDTENYDNDYCQDWILEHVKRETHAAIGFSRFYNDGSVDSEFTFTMPIEKAHLAIDVIEQFIALGDEIGHGLSTGNAGMHLSLLPTASYPCRRGALNSEFMANYRKQVTKLLPGLYFAASHNSETRSLEYRLPRVSNDEKYSAIFTHGDTCLEFRLFDTCYEAPMALLDKIEVMAQTLKYYSTETVEVNYKRFLFPERTRGLERMFNKPEHLDALNETLKLVKPNKSIKRMKEERGFRLNKREIVRGLARTMAQQRQNYLQYLEDCKVRDRERVIQAIENQRFSLANGYLSDAWQEVIADRTILSSFEKMEALSIKYGVVRPVMTLENYVTRYMDGSAYESSTFELIPALG